MEHAKIIRGKTLGAWKKYAEENYSNTPPQVLKYIIVLEEELSKLSQHDVIKSTPLIEGNTKSNVKNNTQRGRLAPPPPQIKR
jgi:hypothetical protein